MPLNFDNNSWENNIAFIYIFHPPQLRHSLDVIVIEFFALQRLTAYMFERTKCFSTTTTKLWNEKSNFDKSSELPSTHSWKQYYLLFHRLTRYCRCVKASTLMNDNEEEEDKGRKEGRVGWDFLKLNSSRHAQNSPKVS